MSPDLSTNLGTQGPLPLSSTMTALPRPPGFYIVGCDCQSGPGGTVLAAIVLLVLARLGRRSRPG